MPDDTIQSSPLYALAARYALSRGAFDRAGETSDPGTPEAFDRCVADVMTRGRRLRAAIADGDFQLAFQPVVHLADGRIAHHEVLLRFAEDKSPAPLVLLAEELGFCAELDAAVVDRTLAVIDARRRARRDPIALAVNLSGRSLADAEFVARLLRHLEMSGVPPHLLLFEITESAHVGSPDAIARGVAALRQHGFAVALDDLGAGASSLHRLSSIAVDMVKIDGSLVRGLGDNPRNEAVIRGITGICQQLGLGIIGECVETEAEARILRSLGVHAAQGWHYGRPLPEPS